LIVVQEIGSAKRNRNKLHKISLSHKENFWPIAWTIADAQTLKNAVIMGISKG